MAGKSSKITTFIDKLFLDISQIEGKIDIENRVSKAIFQFRKKMLNIEIGVRILVEDTFLRFFSGTGLNILIVEGVALIHTFLAYDYFTNRYHALLYSCSFLNLMANCCYQKEHPEFKEYRNKIAKKSFAFKTGNLFSIDEWEGLLEFSTASNLPEVIEIVKSCLTDDKLFIIKKVNHSWDNFGICHISPLQIFQDFITRRYVVYFLNSFAEELDENPSEMAKVLRVFEELVTSLDMRLSLLNR